MINLIITFCASFLLWVMFFGLLIFWLTDGKIKKEQVIHALFAAAVAWIIAHLIKAIFPTLRPFQINGGPAEVVIPLTNGGFPSGHTAAAFALAVTIWLHDKKAGAIFLIAAAVVGIARILANVHYPVDILGGAILGILAALAVEKLHFRRARPERSRGV
jgi:undecaprenyl-diphosphatase